MTLRTLAIALLATAVATAETAPNVAIATITSDDARRHIEALASDAMMGRDTPSRELDSAARYIAERFAEAGLETVAGSYFHELQLKHEDLDTGNALSIDHRRFIIKEHFIPFEFSGTGIASGGVVFAGYGISQPDSGYDDYANIDVRGKVVLVVSGVPRRLGSGSTLRTPWFATSRHKMRVAASRGAVGILIVANPQSSRLMRPTGHPWPSLYRTFRADEQRLRLHLPDTSQSIPALSVGGPVVAGMFGGGTDELLGVLDHIDSTGAPASRGVSAGAAFAVHIAQTFVPARNVVGLLRGREHADEYVVLGAHYDHVGTRSAGPGVASEAVDTIYNGADDNASGTAALLMIARAFATLPPSERPSRSILFVAFTAEELGLFGSRAFVATSPIETSKMVAMLNMDMVGRNSFDTLSVGGMVRSPELSRALDLANRHDPFVIAGNIERDFYRSDQAPFARAGIPVLFFHSGEHADYHREGDHADRIDNAKVARVARLIFRTAWSIAEMQPRPAPISVDLNDPRASFIFDR